MELETLENLNLCFVFLISCTRVWFSASGSWISEVSLSLSEQDSTKDVATLHALNCGPNIKDGCHHHMTVVTVSSGKPEFPATSPSCFATPRQLQL